MPVKLILGAEERDKRIRSAVAMTERGRERRRIHRGNSVCNFRGRMGKGKTARQRGIG